MTKELEQLDEKGFVFLDDNTKPFWIRMWGGEPWCFRWNPDNKWVSQRRVNQMEIWLANEKRIPDEAAELYHKLNNEGI